MTKPHTLLMGLLAETMVHVGSGRSLGVVDLPVVREPATDFPYIPGSSLKGALRDLFREQGLSEQADRFFGDERRAGRIRISDALLLLLPVRSLSGAYRWLSCPLLLERFRRMMGRIVLGGLMPEALVPSVGSGEALVVHPIGSETLFLEEREFSVRHDTPRLSSWAEVLRRLIVHEETLQRVEKYLTLVSDEDFAWFARYALAIVARNKLHEETKRSENLWYEEALPPDTLMCALWQCLDEETYTALREALKANGWFLQVGGNETTGQGWMSVKVVEAK